MNQKIYNYSIHLLSRQDYSEFKLRQKLRSKKDYLPHEIDEVILTLNQRGLLREDNYRRLFIRKWMLKGESKEKIKKRGALEKLNFDESEFETINTELGFTDQESVEKLISKKLRSKNIPTTFEEKLKLKMKIIRFLISKGHDYEKAKASLNKFLANTEETYLD